MIKGQRLARSLLTVSGLLFCHIASSAVLGPGYSLARGQRLYSTDGRFFAHVDDDGDFAVVRTADGARAWSTGTAGSGATTASMQRDGALVLLTSDGRAAWRSPTGGRHRVFGVTSWGTAVVIDARKWKPRRKRGEPIVEQMLRRRAFIEWQSTAFNQPPKYRQR
ncbi:hypothetical protein [Luteibacter sp.]|uniref:hypothetical protein n=1 Tax=Luteibacter sp. TaxID=1886636 RepID=UPI003F7E1CDF